MAGYDAHKNLAYSTVATGSTVIGSTSATGLIVATGDGTKFPSVPFNITVWPLGVQPSTTNAEIMRVTAISTDTLTVTRNAETGGTALSGIAIGYQVASTITAKTLTDIENGLLFNPLNYGAKGDGVRVFGAVTANTTAVSCAGASFSSATDVGKLVCVFSDFAGGTLTTIASVTDATHIVLTAASGITTTSLTGYVIYGTDDSTAINAALTAAAAITVNNLSNGGSTSLSSGRAYVELVGRTPDSLYCFSSQITIPAGVIFNAIANMANFVPQRNAPCIIVSQSVTVLHLELENLFGTGIKSGAENVQGNIEYGTLRIWHTGQGGACSSLAATPSGTGGTLAAGTYFYTVHAIDSAGGMTPVSNEVSATTTGTTSSVALTWANPSGTVSNRVYRGTNGALSEAQYYAIATATAYTDTNAAITGFGFPVGGGTALFLLGYQFDIDTLFIKTASQLGLYHAYGGDLTMNKAFIIGCFNGFRCSQNNQVRCPNIYFDTCGQTTPTTQNGLAIDSGCSNCSFGVQAFTVVGQTTGLKNIVAVGPYANFQSTNIRVDLQGNDTGGQGLNIANVADFYGEVALSNSTNSSIATLPITTAVVYGTGNTGYCEVNGVASASIAATSGTIYGNLRLNVAGTIIRVGAEAPAPVTLTDAATIATDASLANHFRVTLAGNRTLGAPTNPVNGQRVVWEFIQDGTGTRTLALNAVFALGTDIAAVTLTTTINKRDLMGAVYNSTLAKWLVIAFVKGY